jgi:hypothetical protein
MIVACGRHPAACVGSVRQWGWPASGFGHVFNIVSVLHCLCVALHPAKPHWEGGGPPPQPHSLWPNPTCPNPETPNGSGSHSVTTGGTPFYCTQLKRPCPLKGPGPCFLWLSSRRRGLTRGDRLAGPQGLSPRLHLTCRAVDACHIMLY